MALYSLVPRPSLGYEAWPQIESYESESRLHSAIRYGDVESLRSVIQLDPELHSTEPDLLHRACRWGHLEVVKLLIEELRWNPQCMCKTDSESYMCFFTFDWANPRWNIKKGDTPLHVACRCGHTEIVRYLKHSNGEPIPNATTGELPLHIACYRKDLELVKLVSDCDVNAKIKCEVYYDFRSSLAKEGDTPLHVACRESNLEIVSYLCKEKNCDTNIQNAAGELPLHIACGRSPSDGRTLDIVKLVSESKNKYIQNVAGELPRLIICTYACARSSYIPSIIAHQVRVGIVNAQTLEGKDTPLHVACRQSNLEVVRYLCKEKHCDTNIQNAAGELPLHIACGKSPSDWQTLYIVALVSNCNVNTQTWPYRNTPLHVACRDGNLKTVRYLCKEKHCDTNIQNAVGEIPLHIACGRPLLLEKESAEIVKYLVEERHCDTTVRNSNGELPLHIACAHTSLEVVKLVSNCDVNAKTSHKGNTPLHIACEKESAEIVKYLVEERHCDTSVKNSNRELPLHIACAHKSLEVVKLVSNCDVDVKTRHTGNTPLHIAYQYGEKSIVKFLVEVKFCALTIKNHDGLLPANSELMLQAKYQQSRNIKDYQAALKQKGALPIRLLKLLISGPPRVGKSSLKWRLVGKRIEIEFLPSTGVADAPIRVTIKRLGQSIANACGLQWTQLSIDERAAAILAPLLENTASIVAGEQKEQQAVVSEKNETQAEQKQESFVMYSASSLESHEALTHHETTPDRVGLLDNKDHNFSNQSAASQSDILQSDSKSSHNLVTTCTTSDPCQYKEFVTKNMKGVDGEYVTPKEMSRHPPQVSDVDPTLLVDTTATSTTSSITTSATTTAITDELLSTCPSVGEPLSTYPGFKDLEALVSIPLLQESDEEKLKELLANTTTIHIVDTGGQPEFHEILPALVTGPAVNLILFKLNEDLHERYVIEYLSPEGKSSEPYVTSYTNEDVIFQTLSTIACFSHHDSGASCVNAVDQEAVAVLVGTHMDQISQDKETRENKIKEVDESLRERIQKTEFYTGDLIKFFNPSSKQMIVPVNNTETCEDKAGITALREMLNKIFLERFDEVYVPHNWLIFDLVLKKSGAKTLNIRKSFKIAKLCGIESKEEFKEALWYLHHQVGVLMHFPEVSTVKDVIIIELQLLFDRITDVMVSTFTEEKTSPFENELFKNKGQFLPKRVRSESRKKQDPLALDRLVKLLEYLHIVAHIVDHSDLSGKKNTYFMPCVLQSAEVGIVFHNPDTSPDQPAPLLIQFDCGFCPVGIFCAVVVYLLSGASCSEVKWKLSEEEKLLYRNMITFNVGKAYDKVTLIARTTYYEIWFQRQMDIGATIDLHQVCNKVRDQLHAAIQTVSDTLHYSYRSSHQFGFYCPQTACCISHMAPRNHVAVCTHDNPSHMECRVSGRPSRLPPMCAVWYGREVDLASVSVGESEGAKPIQSAELRTLSVDRNHLKRADLANLEREVHSVRKWFDLGLELGLSFSTLEKIKLRHRENTRKCLHDMLCCWLTEKDNVKAKGGANWESLMIALKSSKVEERKLSRNHCKKVQITSTRRPSTSPSLHPHIRPKATPQFTLPNPIHRSPHQQQRMRKSSSLASSKQAQECTQDQRGRTTSKMSDQIRKHPQVQQTAQQQSMPSLSCPTMIECIRFRGRERRINLPQEIGVKYYQFGILLLEDATGARVQAIAHKHSNDAEQINLMILQEWIGGRGAKPVKWQTLVEVLNDIKLTELAHDVAAVKCPDQAN